MTYMKENKAQTSIELILLIGGVIVLVTIVGFFVKSKLINYQDKGIDALDSVISKASEK